MFSVPKLNLNSSSDEQSEPIFTVAPSSRSTRSSSTVSWGSESSDRWITPRQTTRNRSLASQQRSSNPPWATHIPLNNSNRNQVNVTSNGTTSPTTIRSDNHTHIERHYDTAETERMCSALESALKMRCHNGGITGEALGEPTPRQLTMLSLRQEPGLTKPNVLDLNISPSGTKTSGFTRKARIWFTARLTVFDPFDMLPQSARVQHSRLNERKNSISSWALRTFTGLAFPDDSTFALYEDHKTGKNTKPLPFLPRQVYRCAWGSRIGQPYLPEIDLFPGAILFLPYPHMDCAPIPLFSFLNCTAGVLRVNITSVDEPTRQRALEAELQRQNLPKELWYSVMAKLHIARLPLRPALLLQLYKLQARWRQDLRRRARPIDAYLQLYCRYRTELTRVFDSRADVDQSEEIRDQLCRSILEDGLHWFRLCNVDENTLDIVWQAWQAVAGYNGAPHFTEFMNLVFGDLPDSHRSLICKAFLKMDSNLLGHINFIDLRRFYTTPVWAIKEYGSAIVPTTTELLDLFKSFIVSDELVEFSEFEAFYRGMSIALGDCFVDGITDETDATVLIGNLNPRCAPVFSDSFDRIIRHCWGI